MRTDPPLFDSNKLQPHLAGTTIMLDRIVIKNMLIVLPVCCEWVCTKLHYIIARNFDCNFKCPLFNSQLFVEVISLI